MAIAFVMDIDNFSQEAFESEAVTERTGSAEFCIEEEAAEEKFTIGEVSDSLTPEVINTFSNVRSVVSVIFLSWVVVFAIRYYNCIGSENIDPTSDDEDGRRRLLQNL